MGCTGVILPGLFALSFTYSIGPGSMAREQSGQFLAYLVSRESIYVLRTESRFQQQRYRTPCFVGQHIQDSKPSGSHNPVCSARGME